MMANIYGVVAEHTAPHKDYGYIVPQFLDKEKGSTANTALWDDCFLNQKRYQYIAVARDRHYESFVGQPSGGSRGSLSKVILPTIGIVIFYTNHIKKAGCCSFATSNAFCQLCTAFPVPQADWQVCGIFEITQSVQVYQQRELSYLVHYLLRKKCREFYWSVVQCGAGREFPCLRHSSYISGLLLLTHRIASLCSVQTRRCLRPIDQFSSGDSFLVDNNYNLHWFFFFPVLSLRRHASSTQEEKFAPVSNTFSCSTLASISSIRLCGNLIFFCADLALIDLVAILSPSVGGAGTPYIIETPKKRLTCGHTKNKVGVHLASVKMENNNAPECWNTAEASIHNVTGDNTMELSHSTQTRPEKTYLWRFIALERSDLKSEPCRLSVEAATERDARRILAPHFILSLAARLPLQDIEKISTPSTVEKTSMEVRYAQA